MVARKSSALVEIPAERGVSHGEALATLAAPVLLLDRAGRVTFVNSQAQRLFGCHACPDTGLKALLTMSGITGSVDLEGANALCDAAVLRLTDGRTISAAVRALPSGGWSIALQDLGALAAADDRVDPITLLAGRAALRSALDRALASGSAAVFAVELDRFRWINDTLGHATGDAVLRRAAERLQSLAGDGDLVARAGDSGFLLLRRAGDRHELASLAERIVELVGRAYAVEGQMLHVTAGVGIGQAPADGATPDLLLQHADLALADAKSRGGGVRFFEPAMAERVEHRRRLELDLRRALALKQFELFYQPQIDLLSGAVAGFEALLRWRRDDGSFTSPAEFVPIAEATGLIQGIGEWVLRSACKAAAAWSHPVTVAVNLSPVQFRNERLTQSVVSALAHSGLAPERLELEITEGALLDETEAVVSTLKSLRALGVRVSMDDFGTGYSSLSYLRKFPFDKIKIDQSFVRELEHDAEAKAIVRTIAALGASLGMKITAEGVETDAQLAEVRSHGCDYVQGYLTGRPMAEPAATALLASAAWD